MKKRALAFAFTSLFLCSPLAVAQAPPEGGASEVKSTEAPTSADELAQMGRELYKEQKWQEAEVAFETAFALRRTYDIAVNLGHTELRLEKPCEAVEHITFALQNWTGADKVRQHVLAERGLGEARSQVGTLSIRVNVPGAAISIDGEGTGTSPLSSEICVTPGEHRVLATLAGYKPARVTVAVAKGAAREASLDLRREETPSSVPKVSVILGGAAISLAAAGAGLGFSLASGASHVKGDEMRRTITGGCDPTQSTYVTTNASACGELFNTVKDYGRFQHFAIGSFIVGGAAAVGTVVYALWPRSKVEKRLGIQTRPTISSSNAGLSIRGDF